MADADLKLSRRALLGAAFAGPVLTAVERPVLSRHPGQGSHQSTTLMGSRDPGSTVSSSSLSSSPAAAAEGRWMPDQVRHDDAGRGQGKARWSRALACFRRAEAALAAAGGTPNEDLYDRLGARCHRALTRLLHTPAPDVAALALKLDLVLYEAAGEFLGEPAAMRALKQDARRLSSS